MAFLRRSCSWFGVVCALLAILIGLGSSGIGQELAKRLILKDGSYQLATKWEIKGDRVRYMSSERNDWEELPNSMVDWPATEKWEKDRAAGVASPEAIALDKEIAAEREAELTKTPQVAPGLHLPEEGSMLLLDTYQGQPQLIELAQNGAEVNRNRTQNIIRAAVIPIASGKQTIELDGIHAAVQAHATLPSIYVNVSSNQEGTSGGPERPEQPEQPWDRFHIVRAQEKKGKRVVGVVKISPLGRAVQQQNLIQTDAIELKSGWVKVTPMTPLEPGEYAVVELLGKEGMNTFVWDFGVNPAAPANAAAVKPETTSH